MQLDIQYVICKFTSRNYFMLSKSRYISILFSRSFSHMVVDFCCAAAVFSIWNLGLLSTETFIQWVLLYNILAFGLQLFLWILADKTEYSQSISYIGCVLVWIWVCILATYPILSMIFLWLGNACFHIWWWILTLALNPWKAREPWIFVAPWAIGLILGTLLWKSGNFYCREWLALLWIWLITMIRSSKDFLPSTKIKEHTKTYIPDELLNIILELVLQFIMKITLLIWWMVYGILQLIIIYLLLIWI